MKTAFAIARLLLVLLLIFSASSAQAQGTFGNLNFESATNLPVLVPPSSTAIIPIANAFPNWTGYGGTNQGTQVLYNGASIGGTAISLITSNSVIGSVLFGNYTAALAGGANIEMSAALAQSGLLPTDIRSVRFFASGDVDQLAVSFSGQSIPFVPLAVIFGQQLYGGDISQFANTAGELRFTESRGNRLVSVVFLDNISFSINAVPEPSTLSLIFVGVIVLSLARRRTRQR